MGHTEQTRLYVNCMEEVRDRISVVESFGQHRVTTGLQPCDVEFVFLQLRKVLELVAFASLTANKEKYSLAHAGFTEHWKAKRMLQELQKINPEFYPVPVSPPVLQPDGIKHMPLITEGFLTMEEFASLYDTASEFLHVANPFTLKDRPLDLKYSTKEWVRRIKALLALHVMHLVDDQRWIVEIRDLGPIKLYTRKSADETVTNAPQSRADPTPAAAQVALKLFHGSKMLLARRTASLNDLVLWAHERREIVALVSSRRAFNSSDFFTISQWRALSTLGNAQPCSFPKNSKFLRGWLGHGWHSRPIPDVGSELRLP
jgi:hypothetical protein